MKKSEELYPIPSNLSDETGRALSLITGGETKKTRAIILKLLKQEPGHPRLLNSLGATYFNEGDFDNAEKYFLIAKESGPGFSIPYGNLCLLYSTIGQLDKAARYAELTIDHQPNYAGTWYALGVYYAQIDKYRNALDYFLAAYSLDNNDLPTAYNIACAYCKLNQPEKGLEYLKISLNDIRLFNMLKDDDDMEDMRELTAFKKIVEEASKKHRGEE